VSNNADEIVSAISSQIAHGRFPKSELFGDGAAGVKIADVLADAKISIQKRLAY
jgi:hypothetical protein